MTTWPTANKATITDIDQGTDNPNLSRVQIKKDIDNINTIIDTFDFSTATQGSVLSYDTSSGSFNTTNTLSVQAVLNYSGYYDNLGPDGTAADGRRNFELNRTFTSDPYSILQSISTNDDGFKLGVGTYIIESHSNHLGDTGLYYGMFDITSGYPTDSIIAGYLRTTGGSGQFDTLSSVQQLHYIVVSSGTKSFTLFANPTDPYFNYAAAKITLNIIKVG
jgi:hypothetical protein